MRGSSRQVASPFDLSPADYLPPDLPRITRAPPIPAAMMIASTARVITTGHALLRLVPLDDAAAVEAAGTTAEPDEERLVGADEARMAGGAPAGVAGDAGVGGGGDAGSTVGSGG